MSKIQGTRALVVLTLSSLLLGTILGLGGCAKGDAGAAPSSGAPNSQTGQGAPAQGAPSLTTISDAQRANRKIIKNAELRLNVDSPTDAQKRAGELAEQNGGYLVSAEQSSGATEDDREPSSVRVVLRVSAEKFDATLESLRRMSRVVGSENITSKDVTEEYIDVEARLKTQKKLEEQYLEILKSASKVDDLLATQKQLAEVRGEIEKLEGKKRYLENQVSLSTITVTFEEARPLIAVSGSQFGRAFKRASADLVNVSAGIVTGTIRLAGVMIPIALLVLLPLFFFGRFVVRRLMRATA